MMFDDLEATRDQLIDQIRAVCKALKYIREINPSDIRSREGLNGRYIKWFQQMTIVSDAQAEIESAGKCIGTEVADEQYHKCIEWKQLEKELERKRKQYARKRSQPKPPQPSPNSN